MTAPAKRPLHPQDQLCYSIYSAGIAIQRAYKPVLDEMGLTYPQYLVLNLLWLQDGQTVGSLAEQLALESSTLTPLLKRLEASELVRRTRNPGNERQVIVALTDKGRALEEKAGCLAEELLRTSGRPVAELGELNQGVKRLRDGIYATIGRWSLTREP